MSSPVPSNQEITNQIPNDDKPKEAAVSLSEAPTMPEECWQTSASEQAAKKSAFNISQDNSSIDMSVPLTPYARTMMGQGSMGTAFMETMQRQRKTICNVMTEQDVFKVMVVRLQKMTLLQLLQHYEQAQHCDEVSRLRSHLIKIMKTVWAFYTQQLIQNNCYCTIMGYFSPSNGIVIPSNELHDVVGSIREDYPNSLPEAAKRIDWQPLLDRHKFLRSGDQTAAAGLGVNTLLKHFFQTLGYLVQKRPFQIFKLNMNNRHLVIERGTVSWESDLPPYPNIIRNSLAATKAEEVFQPMYLNSTNLNKNRPQTSKHRSRDIFSKASRTEAMSQKSLERQSKQQLSQKGSNSNLSNLRMRQRMKLHPDQRQDQQVAAQLKSSYSQTKSVVSVGSKIQVRNISEAGAADLETNCTDKQRNSCKSVSNSGNANVSSHRLLTGYDKKLFGNTLAFQRPSSFRPGCRPPKHESERPLELQQSFQTKPKSRGIEGLRSSQDLYNAQRIHTMTDSNAKTHGFPNFYESTPNVQTRLPDTRNVMEQALQRFEQTLSDAKEDQQETYDELASKVKLERLRVLAEQRTRQIQARTLSDCLRTQIGEKNHKKVLTQWEKLNAPLDAPFPAQGRRKELVEREKHLVEDLTEACDKKARIVESTALLQTKANEAFRQFTQTLESAVDKRNKARKFEEIGTMSCVLTHQKNGKLAGDMFERCPTQL